MLGSIASVPASFGESTLVLLGQTPFSSPRLWLGVG